MVKNKTFDQMTHLELITKKDKLEISLKKSLTNLVHFVETSSGNLLVGGLQEKFARLNGTYTRQYNDALRLNGYLGGDTLNLSDHQLIYEDLENQIESRNAKYMVDVKKQIMKERGY
jgi:hypothetical protein